MYVERLQDLSLIYSMKDLFSDVDNIYIVDGFPESDLVIPTISVEAFTIESNLFELGNYETIDTRTWYIDIFAKSKSQRDEFGYRIFNSLKQKLPVYDYNEGFPPDFDPTKIGVLKPKSQRLEVITVIPELVEKMHYRVSIKYTSIYEQI